MLFTCQCEFLQADPRISDGGNVFCQNPHPVISFHCHNPHKISLVVRRTINCCEGSHLHFTFLGSLNPSISTDNLFRSLHSHVLGLQCFENNILKKIHYLPNGGYISWNPILGVCSKSISLNKISSTQLIHICNVSSLGHVNAL